MTIETTPVDTDDLEAFEGAFFGKTSATQESEQDEPEASEEVEEEADEAEDNSLEPDEAEDADESPDDEDEDEEEEELEEVPQLKKGRKNARERIDELTAEKYELRRELEALRREMEQSKAQKPEVKEEAPAVTSNMPTPDDVDDKGEPKYPLGEFDPQFIRDLTKATIEAETKAAREQAQKEEAAREAQAVRDNLVQEYAERFAEVEEEIPNLRENVVKLQDAFQNIDPNYGDYIAMTIMSLENGPRLMNYLSQNIGEAQRIVASGPAAATLALGRLDARISATIEKETKRNTKEVSKAAPPPEERVRGRGGRFTVSPDTDDLDAFERVFFK